MAIWALTEERIEKLNKQIGDLTAEHKTLSQTAEKELWNTDLDDFIAEWDFQLEDEKKRAQKQSKGGRRASTKLRIGGKPAKKRAGAGSDDDDYDFVSIKANKAKAAVKTEPKKQTGLVDWGLKPKAKIAPLVNGIEQKPVAAPPAAADLSDEDVKPPGRAIAKKAATATAAPATKAKAFTIDDDSDGENVIAAVAKEAKAAPNSRAARTVAKKPVKYNNSSDAMSDDGDFDVSQMVKGIGSTISTAAKPMFTESAARLPAATAAASKLKASRTIPDYDTGMDMEETNYEALIPKGSPAKPAARSARDMAATDEDDSLLSLHPAGTALKSNGVPSKPVPKSRTQSPAAKAYGKKIAKKNADAAIEKAKPAPVRRGKKTILSDDEDEDEHMPDEEIPDMGSELDSDMDLVAEASKKPMKIPPPAQTKANANAKALAKPAAKASAKSRKAKDDNDDDDEISMTELDDLPAARPSRRAVATKKAMYVDSEEEDEDDMKEEDDEASEDYDDDDDE